MKAACTNLIYLSSIPHLSLIYPSPVPHRFLPHACYSQLIEPLGLAHTGVSSTATLEPLASSICHRSAYPQDWGRAAPAGGLYSSARDLAALLAQLIGPMAGEWRGSLRVLNEETRRLMLQPNMMLQGSQFVGPGAWEGRYVGDFQVFGKAGSVSGYTAYIAVVPQLRISWAFLRNGVAPAALRHTLDDLGGGVISSLGRLLPAINASLVLSEPPPNATYPSGLALGTVEGTYCGQTPGVPGFIPGASMCMCARVHACLLRMQ